MTAPRIYFAPIHVERPKQAALDAHLNTLAAYGVDVVNTEIRDPAMLPYVDGMIGDFSFDDPRVEAEIFRARELGKPVLAMASVASGRSVPESVRQLQLTEGSMFIPAYSYSAPFVAVSAMKVFLDAYVGYRGPTENRIA
jgi:hypothetical protein